MPFLFQHFMMMTAFTVVFVSYLCLQKSILQTVAIAAFETLMFWFVYDRF